MISLFKRDFDGNPQYVKNEITPGAEWVMNGEGILTIKWDGTSCLIRDGKIYKRYDAKNGKKPPDNFEPCQEPDEKTGHWPGWVPCDESNPNDKWHIEALKKSNEWEDGTYELCGPKINGNPHEFSSHLLIRHLNRKDIKRLDRQTLSSSYIYIMGLEEYKAYYFDGGLWQIIKPISFEEVRNVLYNFGERYKELFSFYKEYSMEMPNFGNGYLEGVVWHHKDDNRMVKIKRKDFQHS